MRNSADRYCDRLGSVMPTTLAPVLAKDFGWMQGGSGLITMAGGNSVLPCNCQTHYTCLESWIKVQAVVSYYEMPTYSFWGKRIQEGRIIQITL